MRTIYISGPYRADTKAGIGRNIRHAREASKQLWKQGWFAFCPHMNTAFFDGIVSDEQFIRGDLEILKHFDAIYMLHGWSQSKGSIREHQEARRHGLKVFFEGGHDAGLD